MKRVFSFLALSLVFFSAPLGAAPIDVEIERGAEEFDLGLSKFVPKNAAADATTLGKFNKTLIQDLTFSRLFNLVSKGPLVKSRSDVAAWSKLGSQMVVSGEIRVRSNRQADVAARIYEVKSSKVLHKVKLKGSWANTRRLAHETANEVVTYFTGVKGVFTSRIAFVNDGTGRKELYVADYDGRGARRVTNDNSIVILPRISPNGEKIVFTSYVSGNPDLYLMNSNGTGRKKMSAKAGLNVSPSWSPNNTELAVTLSIDGPPNIYLMDLTGRVLRRLTDGKGADTAPSFSPEGTQIAFTSDRAGAPHIYVVGVDGTGLRRLTTEGHCDSAAWSPDGKTLVYVKGKAGSKFDIYSIEVLTGIERRLTWADGDNENPGWSPDSRSIIFTSTRRGKSELFTMSADGSNQEPLGDRKGQSFTPHWSN